MVEGIRFLEKPGKTKLVDLDEAQDYLAKVGALISDALDAEEAFGVDELEEFAERQRRNV